MQIRLVDGNSIGYTQHRGNACQIGAGIQTQAVAGFLQYIRGWHQAEPESLLVVLWDGHTPWRSDLAVGYTAGPHRGNSLTKMPQPFEVQRPWVQKALQSVPVIQVRHPSMEAADIAYVLSRELAAQGQLVTLLSFDPNWLQCVRSRVSWTNPKTPKSTIDQYTFKKETGYAGTSTMVEARALCGEVDRGLEGVQGITSLRAQELLTQWGTLSGFWKAADDPFFQGPAYWLQATLPEVRIRVLRNMQVMDLRSAPVPNTTLAQVTSGVYSDIDLYELFVDLDIPQLRSSFSSFCVPFETDLTKEQTSLLRRAVLNMSRGSPAAGNTRLPT